MKLAGSILVIFGAVYGYVVNRQAATQTMRLLRALTDDLRLLRCRVCVQRATLPSILADDLSDGLSGRYLWMPLVARMSRAEGAFADCWDKTMDELPAVIAQCLAPLGKLLPVGGDTLAHAIDEVHRELLALADEQQRSYAVSSRLSAAVCFSAAALFILIYL